MKRFTMYGPSGKMTTMAPSAAKAKQNFRYRLATEYGMGWFKAREYDYSDITEEKI